LADDHAKAADVVSAEQKQLSHHCPGLPRTNGAAEDVVALVLLGWPRDEAAGLGGERMHLVPVMRSAAGL
jgi:hypothetical protein